MGISQSGKSPDIVAVLTEAQKQGALTAAITNFPHSDLGQAAEYVIDLQAGEEIGGSHHKRTPVNYRHCIF
jgi:glucosamine--fructose-6-phosphate aminotransferase (isomerizing)